MVEMDTFVVEKQHIVLLFLYLLSLSPQQSSLLRRREWQC
jgi:hypothetical protein